MSVEDVLKPKCGRSKDYHCDMIWFLYGLLKNGGCFFSECGAAEGCLTIKGAGVGSNQIVWKSVKMKLISPLFFSGAFF